VFCLLATLPEPLSVVVLSLFAVLHFAAVALRCVLVLAGCDDADRRAADKIRSHGRAIGHAAALAALGHLELLRAETIGTAARAQEELARPCAAAIAFEVCRGFDLTVGFVMAVLSISLCLVF